MVVIVCHFFSIQFVKVCGISHCDGDSVCVIKFISLLRCLRVHLECRDLNIERQWGPRRHGGEVHLANDRSIHRKIGRNLPARLASRIVVVVVAALAGLTLAPAVQRVAAGLQFAGSRARVVVRIVRSARVVDTFSPTRRKLDRRCILNTTN